ncbi:MAG TPA: hypothetical protein V6D12_13720 [Candidatus Obscuribacterales bacterium]
MGETHIYQGFNLLVVQPTNKQQRPTTTNILNKPFYSKRQGG